MSVREMMPPLRTLSALSDCSDADRDALLSEEKRRMIAAERRFKERRRRAKEDAEWSTLYRLTCLLVALVVGFSPLLMVAAYFLLVGLDQEDGGKCSYVSHSGLEPEPADPRIEQP
tara:strand:+ start:293 stop:640 length:348 start_codon:yes stop_codon:yes gene_type:complete